ncbi:MAG: PAS domain-containing protein, partial [Desulfobacterales bacterium]
MTKISNTPQAANPVFKQELFDDFKRLANCSQDGIYHYDIDSRRFLFYNQKFRIFFRLDDQAEINISSDHIVTSMHPKDRQQALKALNESLSAGHTEGEAEYRVLYSDGAIRWLHDRWIVIRNPQGKPLAVQGFIRDNTQRKLAELQFIESTQNALIGSYIVQEGKFQYVNPKFISITGYTE